MVGTVKRSFQKTVGRRKLTDELLYTTLCEIESVVNSRPLTSIGNRNSPIEPLRPIDFIYKDVRHGTTQLTMNEDNEDPDYQPYPELSSQKAAKQAISETEKITKKFWTIWKNEYLMELRNRHKMAGKISRTSNHPPTVGEVVLMDDDSQLPRGQWPMAVILDLVTSRDSEVRSAMLQTSSGKIVQRPVNRLIPLEIKASVESPSTSDTDLLATQETEARTTTKPGRRNPPEVAVRLQPPRAAKNTTSYREEQPTARKGSQSLSTSTLITMVTCIFALSNVNAASASSISCSTRGVKVNDKVLSEAELCINYKHCTIYPPGAITKEVALPFHYLVNRHTVQWRTIMNKKQHVDTIDCPAHEVCASINCIFCLELLVNPHCAPQLAIAVVALVLLLISFPLVAACYLIAHWRMRSNTTTSEQTRRRTSGTREGNDNLAMVDATTSMANSKMILFSVISACLIASADTCQYTHSISVNNTACEQSNSLTECRNILESTTTLSERKPQACFRIGNGNRTIGTIEVKLQRVILTCNPVVLFYTRDVDLITESAKRCDLAGSCNSQTCAHVSRTSVVPELRETYDFPGVTRCAASCGGIPCGCLLPMPGCLFSRTYAKPKSRTIYQVFHCPTWTESVEMEYSFTRSGGKKTSESVNVITQGTKVLRNANITLQFVAMPTIPMLSSTFVQAIDVNGTEVAIVGRDDFFSLRCPTWESSKNLTECYVEDKCTCSLSNSAANCVCQNLDLQKRIASIQNRLPLSSSVLQLQDAHGRVYGTIHDAVADITIATSVGFQADSMTNNEDCAIKASPVKGCYNCLSGAEVTFSCYAQRPVVAEIECDQKLFAASCNSTTARTTVLIHPTTARYNESCLVRCGRETHHVILSGVLAFYPEWKKSGTNNASRHANYVDAFNYPDLGHVLDVVLNNWKTTVVTFLAVMAFSVAAVCLLRCIVLRLLC
ncbi:hypothetical protein Q1695_000859 [Nippostrongylus brasiliensis]|nr:hypothetical protein Q1695_000859 [Nippostrongylus brasiliensis]